MSLLSLMELSIKNSRKNTMIFRKEQRHLTQRGINSWRYKSLIAQYEHYGSNISSAFQEVWQYSLCRNGAGSKWHPVHKVQEQFHDDHSRTICSTYSKKPLLFHCESTPNILQTFVKFKKMKHKNFNLFVFFFLSFFSLMHNLKTVSHIKMLYIPNDYSEISLIYIRAICEV